MKKYISIALLLLLMPAVMANLGIDDIRGYVNNERIIDVDKDGGNFDAKPGDTLDLIVRLKNSKNETIQGKLVGTIQNIDNNADITKTQDLFDVEAGNDRAKTLSFAIPANARTDIFDMELKVISKLSNGTENTIDTIDYNVIVDKEVKKEDEINIGGILGNLTNSCNNIVATTNTCFGYIGTANNCTSELSTVKEERGTYQSQAEECSQTKAELERQKNQLENDQANMINIIQCNNQTATAVIAARNEGNDRFNQTLFIIMGGGFFYWQYTKKKKKKSSTATDYENEYFDKS